MTLEWGVERRAPEPPVGQGPYVGDVVPPLEQERRLTSSAWTIPHALEFVGALAVGQGLLAVAGAAGARVVEDIARTIAGAYGEVVSRVASTAFVVSLLAIPYVVLWWLVARSAKRRHLSLAQLTGMRMPPVLLTVALVGAYTLAALMAAAAWSSVLLQLGVQAPNPTFEIARQLQRSPITLALIALVSITLGPFVEELVFRGVVLPAFRRRFGTGWAIVGSSLLFSVIHFQPLAIPAFFAVGVVLSLIYLQTRSLWAAVALHSAYNLVVSVLVWFVVSGAIR